MKNVRRAFLIILVILIVSLAAPVSAAADSSDSKYQYTPSHNGYTLNTVLNADRVPVGVRFSGFYFGDIKVVADIYSSEKFSVDFCINESLYVYTEAQLKQRTKILETAENIHEFIVKVDSLANTQYDGKNGRPKSDVYRYNRELSFGGKTEIDKITYEMLNVAKVMYKDTNGAFNPAVYRLVDLWGFSSRIFSNGNFGETYDRVVTSSEFFNDGYPLPDQKYVTAFSDGAFTDFSDEAVILSQEGEKFYVTKNVKPATVDGETFEQWLDLGGIAKGYVADGIKSMFAELGIDRCYVDAGSSSMAFGLDYDGGNNVMTIPDPFDPKSVLGLGAMMSVEFGKATVSTSGQYLRKYTTNGVEYAHIIDGNKGAPAQTGVKLVTVIAPEEYGWACKGDCLTTALTVMGRDGIIDFMNGYLKDNGIEVIVVYQAENGNKEILSNADKSGFKKISNSFDGFAWSVNNEDGTFVYSGPSNAPRSTWNWLLAVLGVAIGAAVVAIVVYYFVKGRKTALDNVRYARKDKPFKIGDIVVYAAVVLVIAALFAAFFAGGGEQKRPSVVKVVDMETQETLFTYNVDRDEYTVNESNGWSVTVERDGNISVRMEKDFDGKTRFNLMTINFGNSVTVKMTDSVCGFHQDCVKNFPEITEAGGTVVCSPNRIKIVTE